MHFLIQGCIVGFWVAALIGPVFILCFTRSLNRGFLSGFISGVGAAIADGFYALVGIYGLTFLSQSLAGYSFWMRFFGSLLLFYLGITAFFSKRSVAELKDKKINLPTDFFSTFLLTLSTPTSIIYFAGISAAAGLSTVANKFNAAGLIVAGVFLGSVFFALILNLAVALFRSKLKLQTIKIINKIGAMAIILFAVYMLLT